MRLEFLAEVQLHLTSRLAVMVGDVDRWTIAAGLLLCVCMTAGYWAKRQVPLALQAFLVVAVLGSVIVAFTEMGRLGHELTWRIFVANAYMLAYAVGCYLVISKPHLVPTRRAYAEVKTEKEEEWRERRRSATS